MKVKSLPYYLCNTSVAWHDVNDVGVAEVFCRNCVEREKMELEELEIWDILPREELVFTYADVLLFQRQADKKHREMDNDGSSVSPGSMVTNVFNAISSVRF